MNMILEMSRNDFFLTSAAILLALGVILLVIGVIVLITRALGGDIKKIASQTAQLAQKGVAEEVAGLVGNASTLMESLTDLVKTAAGVGTFLVITGVILLAGALGLALQIH
jgi:hypothetical protein